MMMWTTEWPTEPGHYWFWGYPFKRSDRPDEMHLVRVYRVANGVANVTNGHFLYKAEARDGGRWAPATLPEPPGIG